MLGNCTDAVLSPAVACTGGYLGGFCSDEGEGMTEEYINWLKNFSCKKDCHCANCRPDLFVDGSDAGLLLPYVELPPA